jgi:SH3-like domain-containing protein
LFLINGHAKIFFMTTKFGFTKLSVDEFETWISNLRVARTILTVQQHHTFSPGYALFNGNNHFDLQKGIKNHHVNHNGWSDIGQHFTTFPDGSIVTGRPMENSPACIYGQNANAICIENLGDFDKGKDMMADVHQQTIIRLTASLCNKYNLLINTNSIVYHHWFDLASGQRNDGTKNNKSCPGTNFFGGNKVADCIAHFLPLVKEQLGGTVTTANTGSILKYVCVTTAILNIRSKPDGTSAKASDRHAAVNGAVLRVYKEKDGWYKISGSKQHWVNGKFTVNVTRVKVTADTLNVRSGPGTSFARIGAYTKGQELFIVQEKNDWCRVSMDEKWVNKDFLSFQ